MATVSFAVPQNVNYDKWTPSSKPVLDLRLATFDDEDRANAIIIKKAKEMGTDLECLFTQASFISKLGLEALRLHCPHLKVLNLCCAYKTGDAALEVIAKFDKLEQLNLFYSRNESSIDSHPMVGVVRTTPGAKVEKVTDASMAKILSGCPNLQMLDLSGSDITPLTLKLIAAHPKLAFVRLYNCSNLKEDEIRLFAEQHPHLSISITQTNDATAAFLMLVGKVEGRFFVKENAGSGAFKIGVRGSAEEKELIDPEVFLKR